MAEPSLTSPRVILLAVAMLSGGGAVGSFGTSFSTSMASAEEVNRAVAASPAVVTLQGELGHLKEDVAENKALAEKAIRRVDRVGRNLEKLMAVQGVEPVAPDPEDSR